MVRIKHQAPCLSVRRAGCQCRPQPEQRKRARPTLLALLRSIDQTYQINARKPCQAMNDAGYKVELLAAPSTRPLPKAEAFDPMASLIEQEWLLQGQPLTSVTATIRQRACLLYVPDPSWMAPHTNFGCRRNLVETCRRSRRTPGRAMSCSTRRATFFKQPTQWTTTSSLRCRTNSEQSSTTGPPPEVWTPRAQRTDDDARWLGQAPGCADWAGLCPFIRATRCHRAAPHCSGRPGLRNRHRVRENRHAEVTICVSGAPPCRRRQQASDCLCQLCGSN